MKSSAKKNEKFVVALELGSSRAKIGIAGFDPSDRGHSLTVYNTAELPTVDSVRYGRVNNIREVAETVNTLLRSVEKKYPIEGRSVLNVYISIGGRSLKSKKASARIVMPQRREVTEDLLEQLRDDAIRNLSTADELICVEPVRYNVDNIATPRPVGSLGTRLSADFTAVVCNPSNKEDLVDVVSERVYLGISGISVRPIALAHLVLSAQDTKVGCMLVDYGAETITISIFKNYALQYLATIPLGSRLITRDIASVMALTEEEAEELKIRLGNAIPEREITAEDTEDARLQETLNAVVTARLADIVANIAAQPGFASFKPEDLAAGIILTGGGAKMKNFARLLESETRMKVRIATLPSDIKINDSGLSATDNLDIIALLNESAESARMNEDPECVSAPANQQVETKDVPEVLVDLTGTKSKKQESDAAKQPRRLDYGYEAADFPSGDENFVSNNSDDNFRDDIFVDNPDELTPADLIDPQVEEDDHIAADRARSQEEIDRRKKQKDKNRDKNKSKDPGKPGATERVQRFINSLTKFIQSEGEDNSADLQ